jgi:hypothetical protein
MREHVRTFLTEERAQRYADSLNRQLSPSKRKTLRYVVQPVGDVRHDGVVEVYRERVKS